jgi:hypothetical protein
VAVFVSAFCLTVLGQSTRVYREEKRIDVVAGNNLYCAGFVGSGPFYTAPREEATRPNKIVGSYDEQDGRLYSENNFLVINGGADKGSKVGDLYSVIRPRGSVSSHWSHKGNLGVYVQELGVLEVVSVKPEVSIARVAMSCGEAMLGDLIVPFEQRSSAQYAQRPKLDLFGDPSGKATGRIFLTRDSRDLPTRDDIVYVDLGADDSLKNGDYLTIYRPLGKGNLFINNEHYPIMAREQGFESDVYRGGKFSNQAARKYGSEADRGVVSEEQAKAYRPKGLRKVVGEGMVVSVHDKTATVVITRTAEEIHPGDWVEIQ